MQELCEEKMRNSIIDSFIIDKGINKNSLKMFENEKYKHQYEFIMEKTDFLDDDSTISERIYCVLNNIEEKPICPICGSFDIKFLSFLQGYRETCSTKCGSKLTAWKRSQGILPTVRFSDYRRKKMSDRQKGKNNSVHKEGVREKISNTLKGHQSPRKGLTYEEEFGLEKSIEIKKKMSEAKKGKTYEEMYGKERAKEIKNKLGGGRFNPLACKFFDYLNEITNTNGQHGTNPKEYCLIIGKKRYFIDYINHDLKLIIEWDEDHHYTVKGQLKEEDSKRQDDIQEFFPNYKLIRIRQDKVLDKTFDEIVTNIV